MTRATPVLFLTLLAIGWGTSMSARQTEVWWDVDRTPSIALVQVQVGTAAGSQRIQIQMPKRVQQSFTAYFVQASGRRIPIQGSLARCREATGAEQKDTIELDSFAWGEPTATMGRSEFVVEIDASGPSGCRIKLIVPAELLHVSANKPSGSRPAAPGSDPHQAAPRRAEGNESAPARQQGNPTVPLHRPLEFKARSAETDLAVRGRRGDVLISDLVSVGVPKDSGRLIVIYTRLGLVRGLPDRLEEGACRGPGNVTLEIGDEAARSAEGAFVLTAVTHAASEGRRLPEIRLRSAGGDTVVLQRARVRGIERGATTVIALEYHRLIVILQDT